MTRYITDYVKNCTECRRYKATNQTPVNALRFESLSIDLFSSLPVRPAGEKWIFIVEATATKWVELLH